MTSVLHTSSKFVWKSSQFRIILPVYLEPHMFDLEGEGDSSAIKIPAQQAVTHQFVLYNSVYTFNLSTPLWEIA
jgi:hypothetical protein